MSQLAERKREWHFIEAEYLQRFCDAKMTYFVGKRRARELVNFCRADARA